MPKPTLLSVDHFIILFEVHYHTDYILQLVAELWLIVENSTGIGNQLYRVNAMS